MDHIRSPYPKAPLSLSNLPKGLNLGGLEKCSKAHNDGNGALSSELLPLSTSLHSFFLFFFLSSSSFSSSFIIIIIIFSSLFIFLLPGDGTSGGFHYHCYYYIYMVRKKIERKGKKDRGKKKIKTKNNKGGPLITKLGAFFLCFVKKHFCCSSYNLQTPKDLALFGFNSQRSSLGEKAIF